MRLRTRHLTALLLLAACAPPTKAKPYPPTPPLSRRPRPRRRRRRIRPLISTASSTSSRSSPASRSSKWMPSLETERLFFFATGDTYTLKMLDLTRRRPAPSTSSAARDRQRRRLVEAQPRRDPPPRRERHVVAARRRSQRRADEPLDPRTSRPGVADPGDPARLRVRLGLLRGRHPASPTCRAPAPRPRSAPACASSTSRPGAAREVVCDTQALRFTWGPLRFSPDGQEVFFNAQVDGDRNRVQLVSVDLTAEQTERARADRREGLAHPGRRARGLGRRRHPRVRRQRRRLRQPPRLQPQDPRRRAS
jgi:hypothetical protein